MEYEIIGFPGYYIFLNYPEIKIYSSIGFERIKPKLGNPRNTVIVEGKRKELVIRRSWNGYDYVELGGKKNRKAKMIHIIIAELFVPNPNPELYTTVDHIDGNKLNNHPSNLQWMSRGDNVRKGQTMGKWGTHPESYEIFYENGTKQKIHNISKFSRENNYQASKLVAVSKGKRNKHKNIIKVIKL